MNPEQIHDALNLLDDTVIAPVEKLRNRRKPSHHAWTRWICAACICIAAAYTITTWKLGLFPFDSQYADKTIVAEGCTDSLPLTSIVYSLKFKRGNQWIFCVDNQRF